MGEVVPARTSPTLLPPSPRTCCDYPVSKCLSASIVVTGTVRVKGNVYSIKVSKQIKVAALIQTSMTTHVQQTSPFPWQGGRQLCLYLLIQHFICAPGTHYCWVGQGNVEYKVCPNISTHDQYWELN